MTKLAKVLQEKGYSILSFSRKIQVRTQRVRDFCEGTAIPSKKMRRIIADALYVPVWQLFPEREKEPEQETMEITTRTKTVETVETEETEIVDITGS